MELKELIGKEKLNKRIKERIRSIFFFIFIISLLSLNLGQGDSNWFLKKYFNEILFIYSKAISWSQLWEELPVLVLLLF